MNNNVIELLGEINFCPYCGSKDIKRDREEESCSCNECGRDYTIMTHE
jgi:NADH pyrophosphatase NudC (nudix superfamily)